MPQNTPREEEKKPPVYPSIRTYKSDVEQYMKKEGTTLADITAEELRRRSAQTFSETSAQRNFRPLILGAVIFIVVGAVVAAVLLRGSDQPKIPALASADPLIRPDRTETIVFEEGNRGDLLSQYQSFIKTPLPENELVFIAPIARAADGTSHAIDVPEFLSLLSIAPPDEFLRGLDGRFMLGILPLDGRNNLALIFTVTQAERAIAGALRWEPMMLSDLRTLYTPRLNTNISINVFEDTVLRNNDIRILRNTSEDPVLLYTIFNRTFFIIASSPKELEHLMTRIGELPS